MGNAVRAHVKRDALWEAPGCPSPTAPLIICHLLVADQVLCPVLAVSTLCILAPASEAPNFSVAPFPYWDKGRKRLTELCHRTSPLLSFSFLVLHAAGSVLVLSFIACNPFPCRAGLPPPDDFCTGVMKKLLVVGGSSEPGSCLKP